jgi:NIPSNAP
MTTQWLEIRLYKLHAGKRDEFERIFREGALPMLRRHSIDVLAAGTSAHDADSYYLVRAYASLHERSEALERFYGSDEWLTEFESRVMALVDTYNTVVIPSSAARIAALKAVF